MKKKLPLFISILFICSNIVAQNDTIWLGIYKEVTTKDAARFYRKIQSINDSTFQITEYYLNGSKVLEGKSKTNSETPIFDGEVINYYESGKVAFSNQYVNGVYEGISYSYLKDGTKTEGVFKNNSFYEGKLIYENEGILYEHQAKEGKNIYAKVYNVNNPNSGYEYTYENGLLNRKISYDNNGKIVGEVTFDDKLEPVDGDLGIYSLTGLLKLKSLERYKNKNILKTIAFYDNGSKKSVTITNTNSRSTDYFDPNEIKIATFEEKLIDEVFTPYAGSQYLFYNEPEKEDIIAEITEYKEGVTIMRTSFNSLGKKLSTIKFKENYTPSYIENYDAKGNIESTLTYSEEDSLPLTGELREPFVTTIYKDKKVISKKTYYTSGKIYSDLQNNVCTYYDQKGNKMGTLSYYDKFNNGNFDSPETGTEFYLTDNKKVTGYDLYDEGKLSERVVFNPDFENKNVYFNHYFYDKNENKYKEINYFKDGSKKSEILFENNLPEKAIFLDKSGKKLASYNYNLIDGTEYKYFENSDEIEYIKSYRNQNLVYEKIYKREISETKDEIHIYKEIDYNKEGFFYQNGKQIHKATYKNGSPYNGKIIKEDSYNYAIENYENGSKNGEQFEYDLFTKNLQKKYLFENGTPKKVYYYNNNIITKEIPFENELMSGEAIFYDQNGNQIAKATYKDDQIISGTEIVSDNQGLENINIYKDGIVAETITKENGKITKTKKILDQNTQNYTIQHFFTSGKLKLKYDLNQNELLTGIVTSYNTAGKKEYEAKLQDGKLYSGTIHLNKTYAIEGDSNYLKLTKTKNNLKIEGILPNKTAEFKIIEESNNTNFKSTISNLVNTETISETDLYTTQEENRLKPQTDINSK
jgi:uncharacterized protein